MEIQTTRPFFKRFVQRLTLLIGLSFLLLSFQNCTLSNDVLFQGNFLLPQSKIESSDSGGNGGGYEGKLTGIYARYLPDYECEGKAAPHSFVEIQENKVLLVKNSVDRCRSNQLEVPLSSIISFPTDPDIIALKDGLYQKMNSENIFEKPSLDPTEVFCMSLEKSPKYRLKLRSNIQTHSTVSAEVLEISTLKKTLISDVSEDLFMQQLKFSKDPFQLKVDARKVDLFDFRSGQFPAEMTWKNSDSPASHHQEKMLCRLALQYDGVQWPSKPLHFSKILSWTFDQSFSQIFLGLDNHDVSVLDLKMDQHIAKTSFSASEVVHPAKAISMKYLKDENSLLIQTLADQNGNQDLWVWNSFKENPKQLNKIGTTTYEYLQDPITHKILFLEGLLPGPFQSHDAEFYLRTNSMNADNHRNVQTSDADFQNHLYNLFANPSSNLSYSSARWLHKNIPQIDQNTTNVHVNFAESLYLKQHLSTTLPKSIELPSFQPEWMFKAINPLMNLTSLLSIPLNSLSLADTIHSFTKSGWSLSSSVQGSSWPQSGSTIHTLSTFQLASQKISWTVLDMKKIAVSPDETEIIYSIPDPGNPGFDQLILSDIQHQQFQRIDQPGSYQSDLPFGFHSNGDLYFVQFAPKSLTHTQIYQRHGKQGAVEVFENHLIPTDNMKKFKISEDKQFIVYLADRNHDAIQEIYIDYIHGPGTFQMNNRFDEYGSVQDFHLLSQGILIETLNLSWERHLFIWKLR